MITITRRLAAQLRPVLRRAQTNRRSPGPAIGFIGGKEGLIVKADCGGAIVEYRMPGTFNEEALWLPFDVLSDCEGRRDDPVELATGDDGRITARWQDRDSPQLVSYDAQPAPSKAQVLPTAFEVNPPRLLQAIVDASDTCDPDSTRFALGCVQLSGARGELAATDGHQLLVQSGFVFPWKDDLLIPRAKFLGSSELPSDQPVAVGRSGNYVVLGVGPWVFYLAVNADGRFPKVMQCVPDPAKAQSRIRLSADDSRFLAEALPKLPGGEMENSPATLDLNGRVALRGIGSEEKLPTEIVLSNSCYLGKGVRININRQFLARALRFGLDELCLYGKSAALLGRDEHCTYVLMPLDCESAIKPNKKAVRIESPKGTPVAIVLQSEERKTPSMTEPANNTEGHAESNGHAENKSQTQSNGQARKGPCRKRGQDIDGLIRQAEALRNSLRDTLVKNNELLKGLKAHRRCNRVMQNTIASLRQLKTLVA